MALELYRLQKTDPESWRLWPAFEGRVRHFLAEYGHEVNEELFITDLQKRWVDTPMLACYWVVLGPEAVVGHLCSYIQTNYDRPYVLLLQGAVDLPSLSETRRIFGEAMDEMRAWIDACNAKLTEKGGIPITYIEHWTIHDPELVKRMMPDLNHEKVFSVMRIRL